MKQVFIVYIQVYIHVYSFMLSGSSRWRQQLRSGRSLLQDPRASGTTDTRSVSASSFASFPDGTTKGEGFSQIGRLSILSCSGTIYIVKRFLASGGTWILIARLLSEWCVQESNLIGFDFFPSNSRGMSGNPWNGENRRGAQTQVENVGTVGEVP